MCVGPNWTEKALSEQPGWGPEGQGRDWSKLASELQLVALSSRWQQDGACSPTGPTVGKGRAPGGCVEFGSLCRFAFSVAALCNKRLPDERLLNVGSSVHSGQ